ncbi:MAG TPA: DNA methyltransferase [Blastocatellia bacterium]|nr:DNA methyltransferase [Blastocatellia bacterium]
MKRSVQLETYDGTFRESRALPFHRWYPYLEGFGERFAEELINEFADRSSYMIDPFAGCGTALLVASRRGLQSGYSEINPFMRLVIEAKINAPIRLLEKGIYIRGELGRLADFCVDFHKAKIPLPKIAPVFDDKPYFEPEVLRTLLRLKAATHRILGFDGDLLTLGLVALGSILVEVSKLKRAGDLRYRRPNELAPTQPDVVDLFKMKLWDIITDCSLLEKRPIAPTEFLGEDARSAKPVSTEADLIVTSPPYLNGTNYIRNTKLELWLLDFLKSRDGMAHLRRLAVSAGINDVTIGKEVDRLPESVEAVACQLDRVAYDGRIPLMVRQYFSDMRKCLANFASYTRTGGLLLLDIGDSVFCGVHVPTHTLLQHIAEDVGFRLEHTYTIRSRRSRGGGSVGQYLLRFRKAPALTVFIPMRSQQERMTADEIKARIDKFQATLPYQQPPYNKRNWGHRYHSLCSYQAKLKPAIAHFLVSAFTEPHYRILDPFGGVGTIPLEAKLLGRSSVMSDLSPTAFLVAKGKLEPVAQPALIASFESLMSFVHERRDDMDIKGYSQFGLNGKLADYYHPETFKEILAARLWLQSRMEGISAPDAFIAGCLLHILHGNRPYALSRRSHPLTPFAPTGPNEYRALGPRLREKIFRAYDSVVSGSETQSEVYWMDARRLPSRLGSESVDSIITSPPFIHSTRFHTNNWLRNWFCGWEPEDFNKRKADFVEVLQERNLGIYRELLSSWAGLLRDGGLCILHLGTTDECDMVQEIASRLPQEYEVLGSCYEYVRDRETHGVRDQGRTIRHGFLFLKRHP